MSSGAATFPPPPQTASREEIQAQVASAVSLRTNGNWLRATGLRSHVSLARLPLTPWHRQARLLWCHERVNWRVKWCSVVFSDESRFCLYASHGCTRVQRRPGERHLLECIRPWHTSPTSCFKGVGAISYNSPSHVVYLQGKVNSANYIVQFVNPVLLPFLRQEGDVLFQQYNARPHMLLQCLLNWTCVGCDQAGTYSFSRAYHNYCQIATTGARCLGQSIAAWYS